MASYLRLAVLSCLLFGSQISFTQICDCVNTGNCPVPITDNGTYNGTLDVTVNGANDLGINPITSVCFTITHTWIGDLSVSLTSPAGLTYMLMADVNNNYGGCGLQEDNVNICIVPGDFNPPAINNSGILTEYICNAALCPAGICCMTGNYTMACGGVTDPINGALQAPNCDLNDFNVPGHPSNGTWTLTVVDVCNMDTGTLDNFSLTFANGTETCIVCSADGGTLDSIVVTSCFGDADLRLDLSPNYTGPAPDNNYGYGYIISQNGVVLELDSVADLTNQPPGVYHIHGFSYILFDSLEINGMIGLDTGTVISQLASTTAPYCGDFSDNFIKVTILPTIPVTILNTSVCEGECIMVGTQQVCASAMVTLNSHFGCDSVVQVNLSHIPPDTVAYEAVVCAGDCVMVGGTQYCPPSPVFVTLTNVLGCDSVVYLTFTEIATNAIIFPANPPALTCSNASIALDGSGSTGSVFQWSGPNGFASNQPSVSVTVPGDYTLTVSDNSVSPACQSSTTVTVANGFVNPDLLLVGAAPQICQGDGFDLLSLNIQDQNNTNPTITFHSGTPATPANRLASTSVNPTVTTTYHILGTNVNAACSDEIAVTVTVNARPTANFTAPAAICSTSVATVTFTGTALPGAVFNWDFDGGTATPGTGRGPHQVTWTTDGVHPISLTVSQNGCTSAEFEQNVIVEAPLSIPQITCTTTPSTITFSWADVPGSTGFDVNVISNPPFNDGMPGAAPNTYIFKDLQPGETARIEVVAMGNGTCGNSQAQVTCVAADCPNVDITIQPVDRICLGPNTQPINLVVSATGGTGNGTFVWSGQGVTISGNFDPELGKIGLNTLRVDYYEESCVFTKTIDIFVYETPLVAIDIPHHICAGAPVQVSFAGIAEPGCTYTWDFEGGTVVSGSGVGPYSVLWPVGGTYDVTLTVVSPFGCVSETLVLPVTLATPLAQADITCVSNTSGIIFSWTPDPNASSYSVSFPGGHNGIKLSNTSYQVTNLLPGETVPIEVKAIGPVPCGNSSITTTCQVDNCPDVEIFIEAAGPFCLDGTTSPFALMSTVTGGTPDGVLIWSGTGVNDSGIFNPSQATLGANDITLSYQEGSCFFSETITIFVFETPVAVFASDAETCSGEAVSIAYTGPNLPNQTYRWDFPNGSPVTATGPGPHNVSWANGGTYPISLVVENANGCISEPAIMDIRVENQLAAPTISCGVSTTTSVIFNWTAVPGVTDLDVQVSVPQTGSLQGNSYALNGLQPGTNVDLQVTLTGAAACPPLVLEATCSTEPCPSIQLDVTPVPNLCLGTAGPVQLNATLTGGNGSGNGAWSGNGVNVATGMFDPAIAGVGSHLLTYTYIEDVCTYSKSMTVQVFQQPSSDFSTSNATCITDAVTVAFNGVAGNNAAFNWNFGGGIAVPGTGPGPHQVTWNTPGSKTITLNITENGCTAGQSSHTVQVDNVLAAPAVTCSSTTESVTFDWTNVQGASSYQISLPNQGPDMLNVTTNTYTVSGLDPGEVVVFQIIPLGNTVCPPPFTSVSCSANLCSDVLVNVLPVEPICLLPGLTPVDLEVSVSGGATGNGTWSGPGIFDPVAGLFDPLLAGEGLHEISFDFQLVNCFYNNKIEIKIAPPPTADAGEDAGLTCWGSGATVRLGGDTNSAGPNVVYEWTTTNGDLPNNTTILRPVVSAPGTYLLTVTDLELGCSASDEIIVTSLQGAPEPTVSLSPTDCSGQSTTIAVDAIDGGLAPYLYSLNGEPYISEPAFASLPNGSYTLSVLDAAGCEGETMVEIQNTGLQTDIQLTANLVGRNHIDEGETIQLIALLTVPLDQVDSLVWSSPELLSCTGCLNPLASPTVTTTFTVTAYINGCVVSDELEIYVEYKAPVYIPNAFSPNGDTVNDLFQVFAGPRVASVKSLMVFDRWGEMVYHKEDFLPNDPSIGWDGTLRGKELMPAVFAWIAEIELVDGTTELLEGEVSLVR